MPQCTRTILIFFWNDLDFSIALSPARLTVPLLYHYIAESGRRIDFSTMSRRRRLPAAPKSGTLVRWLRWYAGNRKRRNAVTRTRAIIVAAALAGTFILAAVTGAQDGVAVEPNLPTLFIVGDSTASNGADLGWGSHLGRYFDPARINVVNRARAGRSSRTFQTEGLWDQVLAQLKPGDFVLIQFGHNDGGAVNDNSRARGSLPGLGDETQEIDNQVTGKHEIVHTYGWYMRKLIADAKAKGAAPIVLSLTVRNIWREGHVERGSGRFSEWSAEIARSQDVPFVDLTNIIADQYELIGQIRVAALFPRDHTHTSAEGANLNAGPEDSPGLSSDDDALCRGPGRRALWPQRRREAN
jgi:rhamnogalacturonan acetylesterase